jgi:hypothetical protein
MNGAASLPPVSRQKAYGLDDRKQTNAMGLAEIHAFLSALDGGAWECVAFPCAAFARALNRNHAF